jgi:hypothetical protein
MFAAVVRRYRSRLPRPLAVSLLIGSAIVGTVACSSSAPSPTPAKPAATRPASSASPAAKTSASPSASPKPGASPVASNVIEIADATMADATPWITLRLADGEPVIVSGWKLEVGTQSATVPGNAILNPGDTLTLRAGDGLSSDREIFLGAESQAMALAAAPGARVRLIKPTGEVAAETTVPRF